MLEFRFRDGVNGCELFAKMDEEYISTTAEADENGIYLWTITNTGSADSFLVYTAPEDADNVKMAEYIQLVDTQQGYYSGITVPTTSTRADIRH